MCSGKKVSRPLTAEGLFVYGPLGSGAYLVGEPGVVGWGDQGPVRACPLSGVLSKGASYSSPSPPTSIILPDLVLWLKVQIHM